MALYETSPEVASIAAKLMDHENPDVRSLAASALVQHREGLDIAQAVRDVAAGKVERVAAPGQWVVFRNEVDGVTVSVMP